MLCRQQKDQRGQKREEGGRGRERKRGRGGQEEAARRDHKMKQKGGRD